jgi:hypothetical protein
MSPVQERTMPPEPASGPPPLPAPPIPAPPLPAPPPPADAPPLAASPPVPPLSKPAIPPPVEPAGALPPVFASLPPTPPLSTPPVLGPPPASLPPVDAPPFVPPVPELSAPPTLPPSAPLPPFPPVGFSPSSSGSLVVQLAASAAPPSTRTPNSRSIRISSFSVRRPASSAARRKVLAEGHRPPGHRIARDAPELPQNDPYGIVRRSRTTGLTRGCGLARAWHGACF